MKVSVMFSGGKDSLFAVQHCLKQGWEIETLIAVKPKNDEAYLWHYATVEWTPLAAKAMNMPLVLLECDVIGPAEEAAVLDSVFEKLESDAIVLGGVGLQRTQINEIRKVAERHGKKVIVPHEHLSSEQLLLAELQSGMEIVMTEVAAAGLGKELLGMKLTLSNFSDFKKLAEKSGFDVLGEGGAYNTFVLDAPFFDKKIVFSDCEVRWDSKTRSGHILVKNSFLSEKVPLLER